MSQSLSTIRAGIVRAVQVKEMYLSGSCLRIIAILKILVPYLDNPSDKELYLKAFKLRSNMKQ